MDRPRSIILVRHGESVWNAWGRDKKKQGIPPPGMEGIPDHKTPLTERGKEQARITGIELAKLFPNFALIYHSPYTRTTQTAEIIANQFKPKPQLYRDLLLVEQQFGWLDAAVYPDTQEFIEMQETFEKIKKSVGKFYVKPPNGESWFDVTLRTHHFLEKIFRPEYAGKDVCIVSHAVTNATFHYHFAGRDEEETIKQYKDDELDNCGVVHFRYNRDADNKWDMPLWNKCFWKDKESM